MQKYELTQAGYEALCALGADAKTILAQHAKMMPQKGVHKIFGDLKTKFETFQNHKEKLTDDKLRVMFGVNYRGITYYNLDNKTLFGNYYTISNYQGSAAPANTYAMQACRSILECEPKFADYEVIAYVLMKVPSKSFRGIGKQIANPIHDPQGGATVGTLITRNCTTGTINPLPREWLGVSNMAISEQPITLDAELFTILLTHNPVYRQAMVDIHTNAQQR